MFVTNIDDKDYVNFNVVSFGLLFVFGLLELQWLVSWQKNKVGAQRDKLHNSCEICTLTLTPGVELGAGFWGCNSECFFKSPKSIYLSMYLFKQMSLVQVTCFEQLQPAAVWN